MTSFRRIIGFFCLQSTLYKFSLWNDKDSQVFLPNFKAFKRDKALSVRNYPICTYKNNSKIYSELRFWDLWLLGSKYLIEKFCLNGIFSYLDLLFQIQNASPGAFKNYLAKIYRVSCSLRWLKVCKFVKKLRAQLRTC